MDMMEKRTAEEQSLEFKKKVMEKNEGIEEAILDTLQKGTSRLLPERWRTTRKQKREKVMVSTPENVRIREEAAARCTAKIRRTGLKKQARKARAEHHVRNCLGSGKKKVSLASPVRLTMYMASLDIKTAFDEAKPNG